jgi:phage head maturation protease
VSSTLVPVEVDGETLYRLVSVRAAVEPMEVEEVRSARSRWDSGPLAVIHGRFANPGPDWTEIHSPMEAQVFGIRGSRFMERVSAHAFDAAIERAKTPGAPSPKLLYAHGSEFAGKKPLGVITNIETTGHFSAQLFDVSYVHDLLPALRAGTFGMSYKPKGTTRGELNRRAMTSEHNPKGIPEWTLRGVDEISEISVVTWPADPRATVAVKDVSRPALVA